jgi:hypothetical protein
MTDKAYRPCPARIEGWLRDYPEAAKNMEQLLEVVYQQELYMAFHEAGHAVIAQALGSAVTWVTIVEQDGIGGFAQSFTSSPEQRLVQALSGPLSQWFHCELRDHQEIDINAVECVEDFLEDASDGDHRNINDSLARLAAELNWSPRQTEAWRYRFYFRTERLVKVLWPVIEALAHELMVNKSVHGEAIQQLVNNWPDLHERVASARIWSNLRRRSAGRNQQAPALS